jgi:hypothetical protein
MQERRRQQMRKKKEKVKDKIGNTQTRKGKASFKKALAVMLIIVKKIIGKIKGGAMLT